MFSENPNFLPSSGGRLDWWVEKYLLPNFKFGFRKGKSCLNNLFLLATEIHTGFVLRQTTACLFLDITGAFDNVLRHILFTDLIDMGIPQVFAKFIYDLISRRNIQFMINGALTEPYTFFKLLPPKDLFLVLSFLTYTLEK